MTFVMTVIGKDTIWVVADRRLSYPGRRYVDDAVKIATLDARDGCCVLAYAGLGATGSGMQPSEWIANTLRGRGDLTVVESLIVLNETAKLRLPRFLAQTPGGSHLLLAPCYIRSVGARLYSLSNRVDKSGQHSYTFQDLRMRPVEDSPIQLGALAGSGGAHLSRHWASLKGRSLLSLVRDHDRGRISEHTVADAFAQMNYRVHQTIRDSSVGPNSIVIWRRREGGRSKTGSAFRVYTDGNADETQAVSIPAVGLGLDVNAITEIIFRHHTSGSRNEDGLIVLTKAEQAAMDADLRQVPEMPDDQLR